MSVRKIIAELASAWRGTGQARAKEGRAHAEGLRFRDAISRLSSIESTASAGSEEAPIFILCAGWRSGSTLLQRLCIQADTFIWGEPFNRSLPADSLRSQLAPFADSDWPPREFFVDSFALGALSEQSVANLYPPLQDLIAAHHAYFEAWLAKPARGRGFRNWGAKEVHWDISTAFYLRLLYQRAKLIFLVRNPYDAWNSYRAFGRSLFRRWPHDMIKTLSEFGSLWAWLESGFHEGFESIGGLLVRYEDLNSPGTREALAAYLGSSVVDPVALSKQGGRASSGGKSEGRSSSAATRHLERCLLRRQVHEVATLLGYE